MRQAGLVGTFPIDHVDVIVITGYPAKRYLAVGDISTTRFLPLSACATTIGAAIHQRFIRCRFRRLIIRRRFRPLLAATPLSIAALAAPLILPLTATAP